MSTTSQTQPSKSEIVKDVILWRRKKVGLTILLAATGLWVLLEVYQFNFITLGSWLAMSIVSVLFLWANFLKLLKKEPPDMSGLEMKEETVVEIAYLCKGMMEEGVRWMFRVAAEREWFEFALTVAVLWLLSYVGSFVGLLTFLYTGTVLSMTVPVIYEKYEDNIKRSWDRAKMQARRFYDLVDEKVIQKINRFFKQKKEKKID